MELPSGGSLTTYKELCALATDLGQPDLLYKFMDLANHAASLQSSRGAAFGCDASLPLPSLAQCSIPQCAKPNAQDQFFFPLVFPIPEVPPAGNPCFPWVVSGAKSTVRKIHLSP